jgi:hypothetical protein
LLRVSILRRGHSECVAEYAKESAMAERTTYADFSDRKIGDAKEARRFRELPLAKHVDQPFAHYLNDRAAESRPVSREEDGQFRCPRHRPPAITFVEIVIG